MTALTREELLDIDPSYTDHTARLVALRHAWNWAVDAEQATNDEAFEEGRADAAVSQAWSAIAEALK